MRLKVSTYAFLAGGLALLDGAHAADLAWQPIAFKLDPMTAIVNWGNSGLTKGINQWKSSFGGVTNPVEGQVGWGPSQRILDTTADVPAGMMGDVDTVGFGLPYFFGTGVRVYGGRTPEPPSGSAIFRANLNGTAADASAVHTPGTLGSAFSVDTPLGTTNIVIMVAGAGGVYTVDAIGVTMQIKTNYSSVDMIPQVTEFFVTNSTLNRRMTWTNNPNGGDSWKVQKGVADPQSTTAATTASAAPSALQISASSPVASAAATGTGNAGTAGNGVGAGNSPDTVGQPAAASGQEDFYQAVIGSNRNTGSMCQIPIPSGTSFLVVNGTTGPSRGQMDVTFSPSPPQDTRKFLTEKAYNATNPWAANTVLYMRELDPTVSYTATFEPFIGSLGLHSITYYYGVASATNGTDATDTSNSNTAAIAGGVVGGVVGGLLIAAAALYFCVWKPRKRRDREEAARDAEIENAGFTPFVHQQEVDGGALVVPPSYDPAWAGGGSSSSGPSTGANSETPLLPSPVNEKQQLAASGHAGAGSPPATNSPIAPDWKTPYLPQSAGGAVLGGATGVTAGGMSAKKGLFGRKKGAGSTGFEEKSSASRNNEKTEENGYSEGMLRAINPDAQ